MCLYRGTLIGFGFGLGLMFKKKCDTMTSSRDGAPFDWFLPQETASTAEMYLRRGQGSKFFVVYGENEKTLQVVWKDSSGQQIKTLNFTNTDAGNEIMANCYFVND